MRADVRRALDVLAGMTDREVGGLALVWKFPDHDPLDPIGRKQVAAALRFGRLDPAEFPAVVGRMLPIIRAGLRAADRDRAAAGDAG